MEQIVSVFWLGLERLLDEKDVRSVILQVQFFRMCNDVLKRYTYTFRRSVSISFKRTLVTWNILRQKAIKGITTETISLKAVLSLIIFERVER